LFKRLFAKAIPGYACDVGLPRQAQFMLSMRVLLKQNSKEDEDV
jgi:hypothetical protein